MPYSTVLDLALGKSYRDFNGKQTHGLFFDLISSVDKKIADNLHQSNQVKPFTTGIIYGKEPKIRFTFLEDEMQSALLSALLDRDNFPLTLKDEEIVINTIRTVDDESGLANFCNYNQLLECENKSFRLSFLTPTAFKKGSLNYILPDLDSIFRGLLQKWNLFSGYKYDFGLIEEINQKVGITKHKVRSEVINYGRYFQVGFVGYIEAKIFSKDKKFIKKVQSLAQFAFYAGVGYKTTMGMGQTVYKSN
ncbi:CRISPR-associated endoribonuclease Cas6 [Orenia metallireducens]|uniref:CRISPR-associated endoribonuclease Cas6 n=1 Tax=Orenia metallireducens TaxID=1413210 RepID=A0A1C0A8C7_9FIRM|nr:CRISPR-associated endoribonuclease Cas6 [Orenia metallireducens]OCL26482.1 CRISPR-associated endoribonuclease Cas6 [Orenia metallireducens]